MKRLVYFFCAVTALSFLSKSEAQFPKRLTPELSIHQYNDFIEAGIAGSISGDYSLLSGEYSIFFRPGYELLYASPLRKIYYLDKDHFASTIYLRHYISASLLIEKRKARVWFPFVELGGGYLYHVLYNRRTYTGYVYENESIKSGPAYHVKPGLRLRMTNKVSMLFGFKYVIYKTETEEQLLWYYNQEREIRSRPWKQQNWQISFGIMFRI